MQAIGVDINDAEQQQRVGEQAIAALQSDAAKRDAQISMIAEASPACPQLHSRLSSGGKPARPPAGACACCLGACHLPAAGREAGQLMNASGLTCPFEALVPCRQSGWRLMMPAPLTSPAAGAVLSRVSTGRLCADFAGIALARSAGWPPCEACIQL